MYEILKSVILVANCLFRMEGGVPLPYVILPNLRSDRHRSKYHKFVHAMRTHKGSDDKAYGCTMLQLDDVKKVGVVLSKNVKVVAGKALKENIILMQL